MERVSHPPCGAHLGANNPQRRQGAAHAISNAIAIYSDGSYRQHFCQVEQARPFAARVDARSGRLAYHIVLPRGECSGKISRADLLAEGQGWINVIGPAGGAIYSLTGTGKLNGVAPEAWLRHMRADIADSPVNRVNDFLPWSCAVQLPSA